MITAEQAKSNVKIAMMTKVASAIEVASTGGLSAIQVNLNAEPKQLEEIVSKLEEKGFKASYNPVKMTYGYQLDVSWK